MLVCPSVLPTWSLPNEASHKTLDTKIILLEIQPKKNYFLLFPEISIMPGAHSHLTSATSSVVEKRVVTESIFPAWNIFRKITELVFNKRHRMPNNLIKKSLKFRVQIFLQGITSFRRLEEEVWWNNTWHNTKTNLFPWLNFKTYLLLSKN